MLIEEIIFCFGLCVVAWEITMIVLLNRTMKPKPKERTKTIVERRIEAAKRRGYHHIRLWNTNQPV